MKWRLVIRSPSLVCFGVARSRTILCFRCTEYE